MTRTYIGDFEKLDDYTDPKTCLTYEYYENVYDHSKGLITVTDWGLHIEKTDNPMFFRIKRADKPKVIDVIKTTEFEFEFPIEIMFYYKEHKQNDKTV